MLALDESAKLAEAIFDFRRTRPDILPDDLFAEPSWDMLLALYIADARGERMTGRTIAQRSGIAGPVLARWMMHLTKLGLIVGDGDGDLDDLLTLSGKGMEAMERLMQRAVSMRDAAA